MDECPIKEVPKLLPENSRFLFLWARIVPFLFSGMGGADAQAVVAVFDMYQIDHSQRPVLLDKCLVILSAIREVQEAEKETK